MPVRAIRRRSTCEEEVVAMVGGVWERVGLQPNAKPALAPALTAGREVRAEIDAEYHRSPLTRTTQLNRDP